MAAGAVLAPWALLTGGLDVPLTARAHGATGWLTFVNAIGGPLILYFLVRTRGATRASSLLFVVPATTAIASWPVLGQPIGLTAVAGLVVAGAGVTLIQRRPASTREGLDLDEPAVVVGRAVEDVHPQAEADTTGKVSGAASACAAAATAAAASRARITRL